MSADLRGAADLFDPARLTLARQAGGLTQTELARRVGLTPGAISQFERGYARPTVSTLRELSLALGFSPAFLMANEPLQAVQPDQAFFRKLASTSRREQSEACAAATLLRLFVSALERYVDLPALDLPAVPVGPEAALEEVDEAAAAVRQVWGLGEDPIRDVVRVIEAHGIPIARVGEIAAKVDAFACLTFERPVVLLGQHKGDRARSRFDAAHELGHLVMHHEFRGGLQERERQAHRFASSFLAPPAVLRPTLPPRADFNALLGLKRTWGMSMQALLMASRELGVISKDTHRRAMQQFGARGWRQSEPGYLGEPEQPQLLRQALSVLEEAAVSFEEIMDASGLPPDRMRRMLLQDRLAVALPAVSTCSLPS